MSNTKDTELERRERLTKEVERYEHLLKLYRFKAFLKQIRFPDMTASYLNRFEIF